MGKVLLFDDILKCRSGKRIPYYDEQQWGSDDDSDCTDQSLHWFHEGYGMFQLYRLHQVDEKYFICEPLRKYCRTSDPKWDEWTSNPSLALIA